MRRVYGGNVFRSAMGALVSLFLCTASAHAQGNLSIDKLWVEFPPEGGGRADVLIRNDSKDRYFVTITTAEIENPGTDKENRLSRPDPEEAGLLVTPNRLILDPGVMRAIRLVSLNEAPAKDRIYRVLVSPEVAKDGAPAAEEGDASLRIKMLAAYDVLVVVRPQDGKADLKAERFADKIVLTNKGNTNVLLAEAALCPVEATQIDSAGCQEQNSIRLYVDQSATFPISKPDEKLILKTQSRPTSLPTQSTF